LFLSHLGIGIIFTLALISREAGVKFFRFQQRARSGAAGDRACGPPD
jgi:hypothetical protein